MHSYFEPCTHVRRLKNSSRWPAGEARSRYLSNSFVPVAMPCISLQRFEFSINGGLRSMLSADSSRRRGLQGLNHSSLTASSVRLGNADRSRHERHTQPLGSPQTVKATSSIPEVVRSSARRVSNVHKTGAFGGARIIDCEGRSVRPGDE